MTSILISSKTYPLWKLVTGALPDKSSNCELYHFYDAKNVHKRSIEYKGIQTIWRHFLKWDHVLQKLSYYDGREDRTDRFTYNIDSKDCVYDEISNKLYINIQPRDMLIWTWCYSELDNSIILRQWEKKLCNYCDSRVKKQKNGCYDYKYVIDKHKDSCPYKHIPKFGLQNKYYYVYYDLETASLHQPKDLRSNSNPFDMDNWNLVMNTKQELTIGKKYIKKKEISNPYDRNREKSEQEKYNSNIRVLINKANYDNLNLIVEELKKYNNDIYKEFILKYIYNTYRTIKELPHTDIIERMSLEKSILNLFNIEFYSNNTDEDATKLLKHKVCMINNIYNKKILSVEEVVKVFSKISCPKHVEILIYFFITDSKIGLKIGRTIEDLTPFDDIIQKMMTCYDDVSTKTQFALDDLLEE